MDLVYPNETRLFRIAITLSAIIWFVLIVGTVGIALIYIGLFALFAIFAQSGFITHIRGNGIRITEAQYPDLHKALLECCDKVGMEEVPDTYLLRTDFFNALATRFLRRHYVVLFTDVVDALEDRPEAIKFYIGHELGHIQRNHIRWGWILAPVLWLPVLGSAYRRAEEYTCDRYGNACCEEEGDAVAAMAAIVAGDTRWKEINTPAYLEQVQETGGFFMSLNEFVGEYPWLCKRLAWVIALRNDTEPEFPRRSALAGFFSLFIPSVPGGFVSLIILIAIVGIMAAVALPAYQEYMATAELAAQEALQQTQETTLQQDVAVPSVSPLATPENLEKAISETATVRTQIEAHLAENSALPSDLTEFGYEYSAMYLESVDLVYAVYSGGIIAVTAGVNDEDGIYFVIEPTSGANGLEWYCYGQALPEEHLPAACLSGAPLP